MRSVARAVAGAALAVMAGSGFAAPCAGFADVDASSPFCADVEWIRSRSITLGCTATQFCPDGVVTRMQMAAFLRRHGVALAPQWIWKHDLGAALVGLPLASPTVVCATAAYTVAGFARQVLLRGQVTAYLDGPAGVLAGHVISDDDGATWTPVVPVPTAGFTTAQAGEPGHAMLLAPPVDLAVGATYRFGIRISRFSGTGVFMSGLCSLAGEILDGSGSTTALDAEATPGAGRP